MCDVMTQLQRAEPISEIKESTHLRAGSEEEQAGDDQCLDRDFHEERPDPANVVEGIELLGHP